MVSSRSLAVLAAAAGAASAVAIPLTTRQTTCAAGVQMFVVRGSTEAPGFGKIVSVVDAVEALIPGSAATAVDYPALLDSLEIYVASVINGTTGLKTLVENYAAACPDSKMALIGYSQGAQAVADVVCGRSSAGFPASSDLGDAYNKNIVASIMFGDPTRAANQTWNAGNVTDHNGLFPRVDNAACAPYSAGMRSWCDAGDRYCDAGTNAAIHGGYFAKYTSDAAAWVQSRFAASA